MPSTIVFNQSSIVGTGNNTFEYKFPSSVNFNNHEIAVESISINYSWVNISSALNNNKFEYVFYGTSGAVTYQVTIDDGLYELSQINSKLQYEMIKNGTFLINASGQNVYYAEFIVNNTAFAYQLNTFPVPISLPAGWSVPVANPIAGTAGWVGFYTQNTNPQINLLANNFYKILGFPDLFSSSANIGVNTNLSYLSTTAPAIQPNTNVYVSMSNIQNPYANPSSIIHNLVVQGGFGQQIVDKPNEYAFNKLLEGQYNQLRLQFLGSDNQPLKILDPDTVIVCLIREKP
tara:strand:- start:916 stop:1782 length:867 start_codon:yes stop_codon:yes gene_type:complete